MNIKKTIFLSFAAFLLSTTIASAAMPDYNQMPNSILDTQIKWMEA